MSLKSPLPLKDCIKNDGNVITPQPLIKQIHWFYRIERGVSWFSPLQPGLPEQPSRLKDSIFKLVPIAR